MPVGSILRAKPSRMTRQGATSGLKHDRSHGASAVPAQLGRITGLGHATLRLSR